MPDVSDLRCGTVRRHKYGTQLARDQPPLRDSRLPASTRRADIDHETPPPGRRIRLGTSERAASLDAPTDIALTLVDYLDVTNQLARRFEQ
jgi:hypothetical protein